MSTTLKLSHMVDLALGTPEVGSVNFNVLHTLLHAMIHKLDLSDAKAEISDYDRQMLSTSKPTLDQVDNKDTEKGSFEGMEVQDSNESARSPYHRLEDKFYQLQKQMDGLNSLPSNADLIDRTQASERGEEKIRPVSDMWQYMQLSNRVDANEKGVGKLFSLVDELMREMQKLKDAQDELRKQMDTLDISELEKKFKDLEALSNELNDRLSLLPAPEEIVTWPLLEDALKGIRLDMENLQIRPPDRIVIETPTQTEQPKMVSRPVSARPVSAASSVGPSEELSNILEILGKLGMKHADLERRVEELEALIKTKADKEDLHNLGVPENLLAEIARLKEELERLAQLEEKDSAAITRSQQAILELQAEVDKLNNTSTFLIDENNNTKNQIETLFNQTKHLDTTKADKEYVASEVDVKADKRYVDGKVNRSLFDETCSELQKLINDLLEKLAAYEEAWKKAHGEMTDDIDGKLDRLELDALKDYIDSKLKAIAKKIHPHTDTWVQPVGDDDAAGIRKQLIHRFNCISCDRPVDMTAQGPVPSIPIPGVLPPTRSPRPYTTFELEQIRAHAKSLSAPEVAATDYYMTARPCGGTHTMTQPHRRITRVTNVKEMFTEEEIPVTTLYKEERDILGADGHVYKGRNVGGTRIDARLPTNIAQQTYPVVVPQRGMVNRTVRPPPSSATSRGEDRPSSAHSPHSRPVSGRSRPQTAGPSVVQHEEHSVNIQVTAQDPVEAAS